MWRCFKPVASPSTVPQRFANPFDIEVPREPSTGVEQLADTVTLASSTSVSADRPRREGRLKSQAELQAEGRARGQRSFENAARAVAVDPWTAPTRLSDARGISQAERDLTLVTRWPDEPVYSEAENTAFARRSAEDIEYAARGISRGAVTDYGELWTLARASRLATLGEIGPAERRMFASPRGLFSTTPLVSRYAYVRARVVDHVDRALAAHGLGDGSRQERLHALESERPGQEITDPQLPGVPVSGSRSGSAWVRYSPLHVIAVDFDAPNGPSGILHNARLSEHGYAEAFIGIDEAYGRALAAPDRERALDAAFDAYRTSVAMSPDERGSAAKSHFALQAVLLSRGIALPPARAGFAPDLEALVSSRETWPAHARTVFGLDA